MKRVLDSNKLVRLWRGKLTSAKAVSSMELARAAAKSWLAIQPHDGILTPVRLEFLCGVRTSDELKLADEFLSCFKNFDDGRVLPEDWNVAERLARRVPFGGRSRGAVDCLIVAICDRLHLEIVSEDRGLPKK